MDSSDERSKRSKTGFAAGVFGIVSNIAAFAVKTAAGAAAGSVTVVADAVNSLTDAGSSVLTLIGFRLASKPADREHPYGHARYEDITALLISVIMLLAGLIFAKNSVEKIITPTPLAFGIWTYVSLLCAIAIKLAQCAYYLSCAQKTDSGALKAAAQDSKNDVIITSSVLLSVIVMHRFSVNIDGWTGLLVSLIVIRSSALTLKSAISPMLGSSPPEEMINGVVEIISERPEILGYHDLEIHNYGSGVNFGSVHCEVDGERKIKEIHSVFDGIENEVRERLGVVLTIHADPVAAETEDSVEKI